MADVVVTVIIDGKPAFNAGFANSPAPESCALAGIELAQRHFNAVLGRVVTAPAVTAPGASPQVPSFPAAKDNSL
jgi:hypothetical protein